MMDRQFVQTREGERQNGKAQRNWECHREETIEKNRDQTDQPETSMWTNKSDDPKSAFLFLFPASHLVYFLGCATVDIGDWANGEMVT